MPGKRSGRPALLRPLTVVVAVFAAGASAEGNPPEMPAPVQPVIEANPASAVPQTGAGVRQGGSAATAGASPGGPPAATIGPESIVVRAARVAQSPDRPGPAISVLDRDEMDRRQARGLDDLLRDLPGVTVAQGPRRDGLTPIIRGLGHGRVVVRVDGARQNFQRDHRGQTFVDPNLLQRVEVLRGPASTLFGSGAIGGVVDFRTQEPEALIGPDARFGGRLFTGYQTNAGERVAAATAAGRAAGFAWLGSVSHSRAGDYTDGDGRTEPFSGSRISSGVIRVTRELDAGGRIGASYLDFQDHSGTHSTADRPFDPDRLPLRSVDRRTHQRTGSLNYAYRPDAEPLWDLEATLYVNDLVMHDRPLSGNDTGSRSELTTVGADAFNTSRIVTAKREHLLTWGMELYRDDRAGFSAGAPDRGFSDSEQDTVGLFVQHRVSLTRRAELTLGLRHDQITQRESSDEGRRHSRFNETSPQVTAGYRLLESVTVHASYAEAFRAPNLRERFIGGTHFGNNVFLPNADLEPEKAHNKEVGLRWTHGGLLHDGDLARGGLNLYRNDVRDFIEQIVRRSDDPQLPDTTRFENVGNARLVGVELDLHYDHPRFRLGLAAHRLRADDRHTGVPLEGIPADSVSLHGAWRMPVRGITLGARVALFARQERLPPTTDPDAAGATAGYALTDVFASAAIADGLRLDLRLDNVFDRAHRQAPNLIGGRGRDLRVQLAYTFGS